MRHPARNIQRLAAASLVIALGLMTTSSASAALLAYDGFASGGASPNTAAGEYETGTGYANDDVLGQAPTTAGFDAGAWSSTSGFGSHVYYRAESGQLDYVDDALNQLVATAGQMNLFRSSGTVTDNKDMVRDLAIGNSLPNTLYIGLLVKVSSGASLSVRSASTDGTAANERRFNFGIDANGNPFVTGTGTGSGNDTNTSITIDPNQTHYLIAKLINDGTTSDQIDLYLDPVLTSEGLNAAVASVDGGNFYVGSNAAWTLKDIFFRNVISTAGQSIIMDELRIGSAWADVTPSFVIPEPTTATLTLLGLAGLMRRRRRR